MCLNWLFLVVEHKSVGCGVTREHLNYMNIYLVVLLHLCVKDKENFVQL